MAFSRRANCARTLIALVAPALVVAQTHEASAQRSGQLVGAGAAGLAVGLILGSIASQGQASPSTQGSTAPRTYRRTSTTRSVGTGGTGQSKAEIEKIQEALNLLGYDAGTVDGSRGGQTVKAITKYQADKGFAQTGQLAPAEQKMLFDEVEARKTASSQPTPSTTGSVDTSAAASDRSAVKSDPRLELAHWETVRNSKVAAELEDYIARYPSGEFTKLATLRLEQIRQEADARQPARPAPVQTAEGNATPLPALDDSAYPKSKLRRPDAVAVIIGNSAYGNDIPKVDFSGRDADAMKLMAMKTLGIDSQNIIVLKDATRSAMEKVFGTEKEHKGQLWRLIDPDGRSEVFVFYSGHGVPGIGDAKDNYLLPVDGDPGHTTFNGYPLSQLYKNLGELKTRSTTVFLDACFSGQAPDQNGTPLIRNASPVFISTPTPSDSTKINVFAAAGERQLSSWDTAAGHGIFTRYVLLGLSGEADEDKNREVTAGELKEFVSRQVRRAARRTHGRDQEPNFSGNAAYVISSF